MDEHFSDEIEQSAAKLAELAEKEPDFEPRGSEWEEQRQRPDVELSAQSAELDRSRSELDAQRRELEAQRAQADREYAERIEALDRAQAEFEEGRAAHEAAQRETQQPEQNTERPLTHPSTDEHGGAHAPTDQSELMKRIHEMVESNAVQADLETAGAEQTANEIHQTTSPNVGGSAAQSSPPTEAEDGEDESIESYMAKLLERVGSRTEPASHSGPPPRVMPSSPVTQADVPPQAEEKPDEPFEWTPRAQAPEIPTDLAAMRDLANSVARQAIDRSVHRRWIQTAWAKLGIAVLALLCSLMLYDQAPDKVGIGYLGASVALLVALFWSVQAGILFRGMLLAERNCRREKKLLSREDSESSAD